MALVVIQIAVQSVEADLLRCMLCVYFADISLMYAGSSDRVLRHRTTSVLITSITGSSTSRGRHFSSGDPAAANASDFICAASVVHSSTAESRLMSSNNPSARCFHVLGEWGPVYLEIVLYNSAPSTRVPVVLQKTGIVLRCQTLATLCSTANSVKPQRSSDASTHLRSVDYSTRQSVQSRQEEKNSPATPTPSPPAAPTVA